MRSWEGSGSEGSVSKESRENEWKGVAGKVDRGEVDEWAVEEGLKSEKGVSGGIVEVWGEGNYGRIGELSRKRNNRGGPLWLIFW